MAERHRGRALTSHVSRGRSSAADRAGPRHKLTPFQSSQPKSCASFMARRGESCQMNISYPILLLGLSVLSYFKLPQQSATTPEPFTQAPFRQ